MTQHARGLTSPDVGMLPRETLAPADASIGVEGTTLAQALVAGDESAFTAFVERETGHIFRVCYRVLGDVAEAEEATQDAFVLAYRSLATYRADGSPRAWLARIAVREAWRRGKKRKRQELTQTGLDDVVASSLRDAADVEREVIANEACLAVREAVGRLHSPYREIILDRYFANLSLREIAAETGRPLGTVKVQVHRGLAYLRRFMGEADR
jgi:RNA polymerase sigma-70 factor (ECF subfamily)